MLPGCVAGQYAEKDIYIDLVRFSEWCKVRLVLNRCIGLDPVKRVVFTDGAVRAGRVRSLLRPDGRELNYDVISLNVGSINRETTERGVREHALCTRPISALTARLDAYQQSAAKTTSPHRVLVVRFPSP